MTSELRILVVGAGPAGLTTALACRRAGHRVEVLELRSGDDSTGADGSLDKACGEGLMPDAVAVLESLGVHPAGQPIDGIRYRDGGSVVEGRFPRRPGLGVRRTELSRALLERARSAGVEVHRGVACTGVRFERDGAGERAVVRTAEGDRRPDVLVAADGIHSSLRREAGLDASPRAAAGTTRRVGLRRHFALRAERSVEVWWTEGAEAYVTPVAEDEIGVAFLYRHPLGEGSGIAGSAPVFERLLARFPLLARRLEGVEPTSRPRGMGPLRAVASRRVRANLVLVGDAGGYVDAITGEGMAIAFAEAAALGERLAGVGPAASGARDAARGATVDRALSSWSRDAARLRRMPDRITAAALLLSGRPAWRRRFLRCLARDPSLFDRILALHVREAPERAALPLALRLGWRLALHG